MSRDVLIQVLGDRPIAYHPVLAKVLGSVKAAIFLGQLLYWSDKGKDPDGWILKEREEWFEETGLSRWEQEGARKILRDLELVQEQRRGVPPVVHFRPVLDAIIAFVEAHVPTDGSPPIKGRKTHLSNGGKTSIQTEGEPPHDRRETHPTNGGSTTVQTEERQPNNKRGSTETTAETTNPSPAPPAEGGPRDPVWDGFIDMLRAEPGTEKEESRWRGATRQIRNGLKREWGIEIKTRLPLGDPLYTRIRLEVRRRAQRYRTRHPEWTLTETALASRWGELGDPAAAPPLPTDEEESHTPSAVETLESRARTAIARVRALGNRPGAVERMARTWEPITCPDCGELVATAAEAFEHPDHQLQEAASG